MKTASSSGASSSFFVLHGYLAKSGDKMKGKLGGRDQQAASSGRSRREIPWFTMVLEWFKYELRERLKIRGTSLVLFREKPP